MNTKTMVLLSLVVVTHTTWTSDAEFPTGHNTPVPFASQKGSQHVSPSNPITPLSGDAYGDSFADSGSSNGNTHSGLN